MKNKVIMKEINMKESTFYQLKRRNPRLVELIAKGILFEQALQNALHKQNG